MSKLAKSTKVQITTDSEKALLILKSKGVSKAKFIRQAIEEKLYRDYRSTIKQIEDSKKKEYCPF